MSNLDPDRIPTDQEMGSWIALVDAVAGHGGQSVDRWNRWLAEHDAALRESLAEKVEASPEPAYVARLKAADRRAWRRSRKFLAELIRDSS